MRIFASDRVKGFMKALGMESGEAIEHRMVTSAIEKAQRKVEGRNFDMRKQLLEYDDVANEQRKVIYHLRDTVLVADEIGDVIAEFRDLVLESLINQHILPMSLPEQWDIPGLETALDAEFAVKLPLQHWLEEDEQLHEEPLRERIRQAVLEAYLEKEQLAGPEALRAFEKQIVLRVLDDLWKEHLSTMDHLRHGIHLRGYAQKNPKQEYKRESFELFQELLDSIKRDSLRVLFHVQIRREDPEEEEARLRQEAEELARQMQFQHLEVSALDPQPEVIPAEPLAEAPTPTEPTPEPTSAPVEPVAVEPASEPTPAAVVEPKATLVAPIKPASTARVIARPKAAPAPQAPVRNERKVGRNEPCPCGSGKKYKHCHGKVS